MSGPTPRNINQLTTASSINQVDLFILRQDNGASFEDKSVSFETLVDELTALFPDLYETPYIIDGAGGAGSSYTTIQDAFDQAILDGISISNPKLFNIRSGNYTEDLTFPTGAILNVETLSSDINLLPQAVTITGNHILPATSILISKGVYFNNTHVSLNTFVTPSENLLILNNCSFQLSGTGKHFDLNFNGSIIKECYFYQPAFQESLSNSNGQSSFYDCEFNGCSFDLAGLLNFNNCTEIGRITLDGGEVRSKLCSYSFSGAFSNITGTGSVQTYDDLFVGDDSSDYAIDSTGSVRASNSRLIERFGLTDQELVLTPSLIGNYLAATRGGDINLNQDNCYAGVTDTSSPRSVTIANPVKDQIYIINDESLNAGTNNITIQSTAKTFDGNASAVISTDGGFYICVYDGSNFFSLSSPPSTDLTWSRYVVDASGGAGSNYTDIQSAIDQASIDNPTEFSLIVIRPGTYSGNITISSSEQICLVAEPTGSDQYSSDTPTIISGLVTIASGGTLNGSGIFCNRAVSSIVNNGILRLVNSFFGILTQAAQFSAYECSGTTLTTSGTNSRLYNCQWFGLSASAGTVRLIDCYNLNNGSVSGSASVFADNSRWIGSNVNDGLSGSTSGTVQITDCTMNRANLTAGTIRISGLKPTTYTDAEIYDPTAGATYEQFPSMQGNLIHGIQTATNLTITKGMFYVGITDTTSARTLTLPDTTTATLKAMRGQTFIFKDESGGAATNNITVATNGGNIDGASNFVINTNYGSITFVFDGTNYWVI